MVKMIERSKRLEHNLGVISAPATDPGELSLEWSQSNQTKFHQHLIFRLPVRLTGLNIPNYTEFDRDYNKTILEGIGRWEHVQIGCRNSSAHKFR